MSPVSTLVLIIIPRAVAPGEHWVQLAHKDNPLAEIPAHLDRQQMPSLEHNLDEIRYNLVLYTARFISKINHTVQKLFDQAGDTATIRRNALLKIRETFRLLIETPNVKALLAAPVDCDTKAQPAAPNSERYLVGRSISHKSHYPCGRQAADSALRILHSAFEKRETKHEP